MSPTQVLYHLHFSSTTKKKSVSHFNTSNGINSAQEIMLSIAPAHLLGVLLFISVTNLPNNNNNKNVLFSLFNL